MNEEPEFNSDNFEQKPIKIKKKIHPSWIPHPNRELTHPDMIAVKEKQKRVLDLRKEGKTFTKIAKEVGFASGRNAKVALDRYIRTFGSETVDEYRKQIWTQYEALFNHHAKNAETDLASAKFCADLLDKICRMQALDVPKTVNIQHQKAPTEIFELQIGNVKSSNTKELPITQIIDVTNEIEEEQSEQENT